jgi:adenosylhomocysteine nucleosidase
MILVIGSTEDDILYLSNKMIVHRREKLADKIPVYVGKYSRQDIVVTYCKNTMMMSSLITGVLIEKYDPYLVINIGSAYSISKKLKQGDLFIAERIYLGQVDLTPFGRLKYGQVPGATNFYHSENMCLNILETSNNRHANIRMHRGFILSTNQFFTKKESTDKIINKHFPKIVDLITLDTESGGIAVACDFYDVPLVCLKSICYEVGNDEQLLNFARINLELSPIICQLLEDLFLELTKNEQ